MALGRYNLTRYNLGGTPAPRYDVTYSMFATMTAGFDVGSLFTPTYFISQEIDAVMPLGWGYDIRFNMAQELTADMTPDDLFTPAYYALAELTAGMEPSLNIVPGYQAAFAMTGVMAANVGVYTSKAFSQALTAAMPIRLGVMPPMAMYQAMTALVSIIPTTTTEMFFNDLVIPPGGRLVIDSENYTAHLDNGDVIYAYSGEWLKFARPLLGVDVASGTSGDIDVSVLYRERYL